MKMPFGKHKDRELQEIIDDDIGYFVWLISIEDTLRSPLREEVIRLSKLKKVKYEVDSYNDALEAYYDILMDSQSIY